MNRGHQLDSIVAMSSRFNLILKYLKFPNGGARAKRLQKSVLTGTRNMLGIVSHDTT